MARMFMNILKSKIIQHVISKILQTCYVGYFGHAWHFAKTSENCLVIWLCLTKPIKKDSINLQETLMFISMQKTQLHILLLSSNIAKILHS